MAKNNQWLRWAMELQALGQSGEAYTSNVFDQERYARIRQIAAEMMASATGKSCWLKSAAAADSFCSL